MQAARRRFSVGDCLGRGGFGEVYRAVMRSPGGLETEVALKVLRGDVDPHGDAVLRLRDEGRVLARLAHPTILRVLDLVLLDGRVALVTEYVDGADLADCWEASEPMPLRPSVQAIGAAAAALAVAHQATSLSGAPLGLVHRDIKPTNIRVGRHGQLKVLDFGIAWSRAADREAHTDSDLVVGSLHYMAPERFLRRDAKPAWDVFGLGACLFEAVAGRPFLQGPMRALSRLAVAPDRYERHLGKALLALPDEVPRSVVQLLRDALAYEASARPSASELEARCEEAADALPGTPLRRWCRERQWPPAPQLDGPLRGRTLTEGTLDLPAPDALDDEGAPSVTRKPVPTLDAFEEATEPARPPVSRSPTPTEPDRPRLETDEQPTEVDRPPPPSPPPRKAPEPVETEFVRSFPVRSDPAPGSALRRPEADPTPPRRRSRLWMWALGALFLGGAAMFVAVGAVAWAVWWFGG